MAIRVLIVESNPTVRAGLRALVNCYADFEVVGEVADATDAVPQTAEHRPDVVLFDISRPGAEGLAIAKQINELNGARVIALALDPHGSYVQQAKKAGVAGYLLKSLAAELEPALRAVAAGEAFYSRGLVALTPPMTPPENLPITPRQKQVLEMIARGFTTKEMSEKLGISFKTVQTHRTELMARLGLHDVAGVVRYAIRNGVATAAE